MVERVEAELRALCLRMVFGPVKAEAGNKYSLVRWGRGVRVGK